MSRERGGLRKEDGVLQTERQEERRKGVFIGILKSGKRDTENGGKELERSTAGLQTRGRGIGKLVSHQSG